jgi:ankyrin repeat protein
LNCVECQEEEDLGRHSEEPRNDKLINEEPGIKLFTINIEAAKFGNEVLLAYSKVNPNLQDKDGYTALTWAAYRGHTEIVRNEYAAIGCRLQAKINNNSNNNNNKDSNSATTTQRNANRKNRRNKENNRGSSSAATRRNSRNKTNANCKCTIM